MVTEENALLQKDNKILQFIARIHEFELQNELFSIKNSKGIAYWDIVRAPIVIALYNAILSEKENRLSNTVFSNAGKRTIFNIKAVRQGLKLVRWWIINELNFRYHTKVAKPFIFLAVSRFLKEDGKPMDAVADELIALLPPKETLVLENFSNDKFGPIKYKTSPYFSYKTWYLKKIGSFFSKYRNRETYRIAELLNNEFQTGVDWGQIMDSSLYDFKIDYKHAQNIIRRAKPSVFFYSGLAKGFIQACHDKGIIVCEIQHSPLNTADIVYSYNGKIDYNKISTLPDYLLASSEIWQRKIFYPTVFKSIGSDYFYNSSSADKTKARNYIVVVSSKDITDTCIRFAKDLAERADISLPVILKLHSAEKDRLKEIRDIFADYQNVTVIYNEETMSSLLGKAYMVIMGYSSVAYQALQMGVRTVIIKIGYYEGCYDILDLPGVQLIADASEIITLSEKQEMNTEIEFPRFFEQLNKNAFTEFVAKLRK